MNRSKTITLIIIIAVAVAIPLVCLCFLRGTGAGDGNADESSYDYEETGETPESDGVTDTSDVSDTIPPIIPPDTDTSAETKRDALDIDVTEVTRNSDAEVVDSTIEYTTKEVPTDAE